MSTELTLYEGHMRSPLAVVGDAVRSVFRWLEASAYRTNYRQVEEYLADSGDVFELERRMRSIDRGHSKGFFPEF